MKAAVLEAIGATPVYGDFPAPEIGDGEVLVKVRAASIKRIDRAIAAGTHYLRHADLPAVVGVDGIGELPDGQRVYFGGCRPPFGAMAEYAPARAGYMIPLDVDLDDAVAAALPNAAMSSWLPLVYKAGLREGETVLALGATGTSGRLAVQVARHLGAGRVVAAGRNRAALDQMREEGVDEVVPLEGTNDEVVAAFHQAGGDQGYDVVLDYLWGRPVELFAQSLLTADVETEGREVRLLQVGAMAGPDAVLPATALRGAGLTLIGSGAGSIDPKEIFQMIPEIWRLAAEGKLRMDIERVPLAGIAAAWERGDRHGRRQVAIP